MPDLELEALLREATTLAVQHKRKGKGTIKRLYEIARIYQDSFTNPANWQSTRVLSLIHLSPAGETALGLFQESLHIKTSARKLSRVSEGPVSGIEYVSGKGWLNEPVCEPPVASLDDQQAIRDYLARTAPVRLAKQDQVKLEELLKELERLS